MDRDDRGREVSWLEAVPRQGPSPVHGGRGGDLLSGHGQREGGVPISAGS
jgi:hypothetical protein